MRVLILAVLLVCFEPTLAAQIESLQVRQDGARYSTEMQVLLDVPASMAYAVLTDYARLARINPQVREVELLSGKPPAPACLRTLVQLCVGILCKAVEQVQDMSRPAATQLHAQVIPEKSNLAYGVADWRFVPVGRSTRLYFNASIEPKFWVPPLVGPWLVRRALTHEAITTSQGIEAAARQP
ncbi:MAG: SRPBCC family protein [Nevskiales bacterium]